MHLILLILVATGCDRMNREKTNRTPIHKNEEKALFVMGSWHRPDESLKCL